jgi:hypothetical protein
MKTKQTREEWLIKLAQGLGKEFKTEGLTMPKYRITCGFPSKGGLSAKKRTIGQCWHPDASADGTTEIIIGITQDEEMTIAGVVAHEMVHGVVGTEVGHRGPFRRLALLIGLEGKMTSTIEGPEFIKRVKPILKKIGKYPHAKLDHTIGIKKQSTRMIKATCQDAHCGMVFRTTRKWVEIRDGLDCPICHTECEIG